jgi:hypothetical protein
MGHGEPIMARTADLGARAAGMLGRVEEPTMMRHRVATVALSWLAMVGVDVVLHAGLLALLYDWDSPFLLRPEEAFVRIPVGYLGFLVFAIALAWLLPLFQRRARP